jgi:hypothetical protein
MALSSLCFLDKLRYIDAEISRTNTLVEQHHAVCLSICCHKFQCQSSGGHALTAPHASFSQISEQQFVPSGHLKACPSRIFYNPHVQLWIPRRSFFPCVQSFSCDNSYINMGQSQLWGSQRIFGISNDETSRHIWTPASWRHPDLARADNPKFSRF